jgi:hypothetical protein
MEILVVLPIYPKVQIMNKKVNELNEPAGLLQGYLRASISTVSAKPIFCRREKHTRDFVW